MVCSKLTSVWSSFQSSVENNSGLQWFCFAIVTDWSRNVAPPSRPIRKPEPLATCVVPRVFPRFILLVLLWILISSLWYFPLFWLAIVITLIFVLPNSIEMRSLTCLCTIYISADKPPKFNYIPVPLKLNWWKYWKLGCVTYAESWFWQNVFLSAVSIVLNCEIP